LEGEIGGEATSISLDRLIQSLGRHAVQASQIGIQDHALTASGENKRLERFLNDTASFLSHRSLLRA
jgi:hypothetical protein